MDVITARFFNARYVTPADARFLLDLRLARGEFLHPTANDLSAQVEYLKRSIELRHEREEAYLVIESKDRIPIGCFRLTELSNESTMNYQSLVIAEGQSPNLAINVNFCVFQLAFDWLAKTLVGPFYVIKENERVLGLFQAMGIAERGESIFVEGKEYLKLTATRETYRAREQFYKAMGFGITEVSPDLLRTCRRTLIKAGDGIT
jgi:hypothetical protein